MIFKPTQQDLLRGKKVVPGWYPMFVRDVEDVTAKSSGVLGVNVHLIVDKATGSQAQFNGMPLDFRVWENAPGFAAPLAAALLGRKVEADEPLDFANAVGKYVMGYVENGTFNSRPTNNVVDFKPMP